MAVSPSQEGVAPPGATLGGVKSRKGARLIIVDASTADGQVSHGQCTSLKMFLHEKEGDYHDAMNADNFMAWVEQQIIPAWKANYKNQPCILVLDGEPYHLYGMTNPFTMSKTARAQLMCEVIG